MNAVVSVTPKATAYIKRMLAKQPDSIGIRITIKNTGCSGKSYVVAPVFKQTIVSSDFVYQTTDFQLYIAADSLEYLTGTVIDYVKNNLLMTGKLVFQNPHEKATCGCGESFYV